MPMWIKITKITLLYITLALLSFRVHSTRSADADELYALSLEDLLQIKVTTATKNNQSIAEAPSIVSVISAKEMQDAGISNLYQALHLIPGFTPITQLKGDQLMVVRGIGLRDGVLVLIDGVPVNDAFDGGFEFYSRPIDDIERIEVIRGPGSALYGGYAVSAVIQLFTWQNKNFENDIKLQLGAGSFDEKRLAVNINKDLTNIAPNFSFNASFSYFDNEGDDLRIVQDAIFSPDPDQYLPPLDNPTFTPTTRNPATEKFNGHVNLTYEDFKVGFVHSQIITYPILSHLGLVTAPESTIKESTQDVLSLSHHWQTNEHTHIKTKVYTVLNESKLFGQSQPPQIHSDEDQDGLNETFLSGVIENFQHKTRSQAIDFSLTHQHSKTRQWLVGATFEKTKLVEVNKVSNVSLVGRGPVEIFPTQDTTSQYITENIQRDFTALYVQDSWKYNDKLDITTGLRFGDYSDFGDTLNPRLGIVYKISPSFYSKLLYGEAYKPPAFSQLFDATPTLSPNRTRGNSELQPTEIRSIEWQMGINLSSTLVSSVSFFNNATSNEIFFNATPGIEQWQNSGERKSRGVEIELRGKLLGLDYANINYSYQQLTGVNSGAGADIHPPHRFNFNGVYQINRQWLTGFGLSHFSSPQREVGDNRPRIAEKTLVYWNLKANNILTKGLDLTLTINNLLNENGRDEIEASIGLVDDIPIEGRKVQGVISYTFD